MLSLVDRLSVEESAVFLNVYASDLVNNLEKPQRGAESNVSNSDESQEFIKKFDSTAASEELDRSYTPASVHLISPSK